MEWKFLIGKKLSVFILNNDYCFSVNFFNYFFGDEVCKFLVIIILIIIFMLILDY